MTKDEMASLQRQARSIERDRNDSLDFRFYGTANRKRKRLYEEFGYPDSVNFDDFYRAYKRNAVARAAVRRMVDNCWQDNPEIFEGEEKKDGAKKDSAWDKQVNKLFKKRWKQIKGADRRNLVGNYSALLIQLRDGGDWREAVNRATVRSLSEKALVRLIPVWEAQLDVSRWDEDPQSETFGMPAMYQYTEIPVGSDNGKPGRIIDVHPDRVFILAEGADDGSMDGESMLEAGFNKLLDIEKISGGSAEGFLKNASRQIAFNFSKDVNFAKLAKALGVSESEVSAAMDSQVRELNRNVDSAVMMQDGSASVLSVAAADPEPTWRTALNEFCATIPIPVKILIGMQTGERASTEDGKDWAKTGNARRAGFLTDVVEGIVRWFINLEIIPAPASEEITVSWSDLLAPSQAEKIANMDKMADVAVKTTNAFGRSALSENEIRTAGELQPQKEFEEDDDDDQPKRPDPLADPESEA
ncbi:DUF1073 domain-containing protein [Salmonella enterica subsp. enterica serovar Techimani]|nr:DUF1073 domain-containing protein [Salmonella enterica]EJN2870982.1 DUF1073 domain-containing protein [Salmonella enterica subsp. enterica serovar Techimani]EJN3654822.1 DUF1073 domain-containing protein [Salmonella enterica subsp. enterica serovar Techimani]EJN3668395.1 DUF1073 domain-containing protein [Salmonella enterica subsp. enterica serovar Techimani]EJN3672110.1 DUF1073 domain-containing protein [Salmonella enterica subsp. enterica serovar Techimani]